MPRTERTIAASRAGVCLVVATGRARVDFNDQTVQLHPGLGLWLPAGTAFRVRETTAAVLPIVQQAPAESRLLARPQLCRFTPTQPQQLIELFAESLGHFELLPPCRDRLVRALLWAHEPLIAQLRALDPRPPLSHSARTIASAIRRRPWEAHQLADSAQRVRVSERTLQRQFLQETGLSFSIWRRDARLAAAVRALLRGETGAALASRVGFSSQSSLSRACSSRLGWAPTAISALGQQPLPAGPLPLALPNSAVPKERSTMRKNGISAIGWMLRGSARVCVDGVASEVHQGDPVWLPSGSQLRLEHSADSVLLPVLWTGSASPPAAELGRLHRGDERALLRTVAARFAWPRLTGPAPANAWGLAAPHEQTEPPSAERAARTIRELVTRHPDDDRRLHEWAQLVGVPLAELRPAFRQATGLTFPRWRTSMRMVAGRRLLSEGCSAGEAAAAVGYRSAASFTRAFSTAHGVPPLRFRRGSLPGPE